MILPRYAVLSQNGRRYKVRVLDYNRGLFRVLDASDTVRFAPRERLTFLPAQKRPSEPSEAPNGNQYVRPQKTRQIAFWCVPGPNPPCPTSPGKIRWLGKPKNRPR